MSESLPQLVGDYVSAREKRLALSRELKKLEEIENTAKLTLIRAMQEKELSVVGNASNSVKLTIKHKPTVKDWREFYTYIKETDGFDLLQRRVAEGAVAARTDDGIEVPGITFFEVPNLSISKV